MLIAVDDTDSPSWMCTTYLATELVQALPDLDVIGLPRLVRLNPAVPWKTRGNGAVCIQVGRGRGSPRTIGDLAGRPVFSYPRSEGEPDIDNVLERCQAVVERWFQADDSDPGLVVTKQPPSPALYARAVRTIIEKEEAVAALERVGGRRLELNSGRGVIGAAAAAAWVPEDRTYEVLTYRRRDRWGLPREVSEEDIALLDSRYPSTFNNYEQAMGRPAIIPHTTCPVLYGIRGDSLPDLVRAMESVRSEPVDRWMLFITNQGTDDHVVRRWGALLPDATYEVEGTVIKPPVTLPGGHVLFPLSTAVGEVDCAAYEPSKGFRDVVRLLRPGDRVRTIGELRREPRTLNLEKLEVISLAPSQIKVSNPSCPDCGRKMKSAGTGQGYRCRPCGTRASTAITRPEQRPLAPGWYEPPVCARRHLSKPLKRMGLTSTIAV